MKLIYEFIADYTSEELKNFLLFGGVCRLLEEFVTWAIEKGYIKSEDNRSQ